MHQLREELLKLSFEFFPPRSDAAEDKLKITTERLKSLNPDFFSVTFGAGGGTREKTFETVMCVREMTQTDVAPHISCIGSPLSDIREVLDNYKRHDFNHLVALRGDLPSGSIGGGALHHASELIEFIRNETGDHFYIEVACYPEFHPQAESAKKDLENFRRKVDAGADSAITQYFYNIDAYHRFLDSCADMGVGIPIVPGIMPITNCTQLLRFSEICGAEIPRWILKRLYDYGDDVESIRSFGIDVTTELCAQLLDSGAPGLHLYTMNQSAAAEAIWASLGLHQRTKDRGRRTEDGRLRADVILIRHSDQDWLESTVTGRYSEDRK